MKSDNFKFPFDQESFFCLGLSVNTQYIFIHLKIASSRKIVMLKFSEAKLHNISLFTQKIGEKHFLGVKFLSHVCFRPYFNWGSTKSTKDMTHAKI